MTEVEHALKVADNVAEIDQKIKAATDMQLFAVKHNDNIGTQTWAAEIKKLKRERHNLHESVEYLRFKTFASVIKSYLTRDQYHEAWRTVDDIIYKNPEKLL